MENIKEILKKYKNIALVGASKDLTKTSSVVMKYLQNNGFNVYPVNPSMKGEKILGEKVFGNILEIDNPVEIVDVFRPSNEIVKIAEDAVKINAKVLWLQLDISNKEAKKIEKLGISVLVADTIMNDLETKVKLAEKTLRFANSI